MKNKFNYPRKLSIGALFIAFLALLCSCTKSHDEKQVSNAPRKTSQSVTPVSNLAAKEDVDYAAAVARYTDKNLSHREQSDALGVMLEIDKRRERRKLVDEILSNQVRGNAKTPLDKFKIAESDNDLMFMYLSNDAVKIDYDMVAVRISREYAGLSDVFKKRELIGKLKPIIDQRIGEFKQNRYVAIVANQFVFRDGYDFEKKSFRIANSEKQVDFYKEPNSYRVDFVNLEQFQYIPVADEHVARTIEHNRTTRSNNDLISLKIYFWILGNAKEGQRIYGEILAVEIVDASGRPLVTYRKE